MINLRQSRYRTAATLGILALSLAILLTLQLALVGGFLGQSRSVAIGWPELLLLALTVPIAATGFLAGFTATLQPSWSRIEAAVGVAGLTTVVGMAAVNRVTHMPATAYFLVQLAANALYVNGLLRLLLRCLSLRGRWSAVPPKIAAGLLLLSGIVLVLGQSTLPLTLAVPWLTLVRDLVAAGTVVTVLAAVSLHRPLRLDLKNPWMSLVLRLPSRQTARHLVRTLAAGSAGLGLATALALAAVATGAIHDPEHPLTATLPVAWSWLAVLVLTVSELVLFTTRSQQGQVSARLTTPAVRRFVSRYINPSRVWAASSAYKAAAFMVDHDPRGTLHESLPASIMQIRNAEIQRCVADVLGNLSLQNHATGHRIFGAIDPEISVHSCVDALRMFACLYLDAGPLVERRINGLAALLPIIDPGLAHALRRKDMAQLIRRNLWFFHFDYGWVDQHVIHTPTYATYDLTMAPLTTRTRLALADLNNASGGNLVWIGPGARDRLIQEAPALLNIIETTPVKLPEGNEEILMFIVRFEHLIPRLQRYFDLDSMRKILLDYEQSAEATRLLNLLGLQIAKAKSPADLLEILASIASVPWRGFREKDGALHLVLKAATRLDEMTGAAGRGEGNPAIRSLHDKVMQTIRDVGYPSQLMHNAQTAKIAMRDIQTLTAVATDPGNIRFTEAWLVMANSDYYRHNDAHRQLILGLLKSVPDHPRLARNRLVQAKAIDALSCIGRLNRHEDQQAVDTISSRLGRWLARTGADLDICCHFVDSQTFLAAQYDRAVSLDPSVITALDHHIRTLAAELGPEHPQLIAIMSRWQEFTGRRPDQGDTRPGAVA